MHCLQRASSTQRGPCTSERGVVSETRLSALQLTMYASPAASIGPLVKPLVKHCTKAHAQAHAKLAAAISQNCR